MIIAMITQRLLPENCYSKRKLKSVDLIVKHYISASRDYPDTPHDVEKVIQIFERYKVSAHYLIARDGEIIQLVPDDRQAWHAGPSSWKGRKGCNRFSIGVELIGSGDEPFTGAQWASDGWLTAQIMAKHGLKAEDIAGHEHIAPGRKVDPGKFYDWQRLYAMIGNINAER